MACDDCVTVLVLSGGKGATGIEDKPLTTSELVKMVGVADTTLETILVMVLFTRIDVNPRTILPDSVKIRAV